MPYIKKIGKTTFSAGRNGKSFGGSITRGKYSVHFSNNKNAVEFHAGQYMESPKSETREKGIGIVIPKKRKRKTQGSW